MSLMGVDIGTTGTKAVAFSETGVYLASAYRTYPELFPKPGWVEMDPNQIWTAVCESIREVNALVKNEPVTAIGCSVLGEAITPIGRDRKPLYNTIPSVDARCKSQVNGWAQNRGAQEIFSITGQPLHTSYSINKVMWLRDEMPELFAATWKFLLWEDLFCCWLGLEPLIDYSLASRTMAFDIHTRQWSSHILGLAGIDPCLLATPVPAGHPAGIIPAEIATSLGFSRPVTVTVAGHDVINGALGAGVVQAGQAALTIGTTESIVVALDQPRLKTGTESGIYACYCHVFPDRYATLSYSTCSGNLLRWYRDNFGSRDLDEASRLGLDVYDLLVGLANLGQSGLLMLPHFIGAGTPYLDPESRGSIVGLTLSTTPADILAAILEGTSFELKVNLETLEKAGIPVNQMTAVGGGARSDRWLQLKANITGIPITRLNSPEVGCLGAALQAAVASGLFPSHQAALAQWVRQGRQFFPDPAITRQYAELFSTYKQLYPQTRSISQVLSKYR